jgi:oligo-1,6-glucosidase
MDLNWRYKPMREDIYTMIRYWLDKGIDGFRLDVISFISKPEMLPSGSPFIGELVNAKGSEHYFFGPNLHNYLKELRQETFDHYDVVTIGETPGIGLRMSELLSREDRHELDMVFNFHHMENPGKSRFDQYLYNLNHLKKVYMHWQSKYSTLCWNSLFYENHDTPRMLSKIDPTGTYREPLAKLLAMIQLTLRGTPFLYQGQELGLLNGNFNSIDDFRDVESLNLYDEFIRDKVPEQEALRRIRQCSRDNGRITMPWSDAIYGGFSSVTPWINVPPQGPSISCEREMADPNSVYNFYRSLIQLRKDNPTLIYGKIKFVHGLKNHFAYYRRKKNQYFIEANLSANKIKSSGKAPSQLLLSNYNNSTPILFPYECRIYKLN